MLHSIYRKLGATQIAVLDVCLLDNSYRLFLRNIPEPAYLITRINVPVAFRRKGIGQKLLAECLQAADREEAILTLVPLSSDRTFSTAKLIKWYQRNGFYETECEGERFMRREPGINSQTPL